MRILNFGPAVLKDIGDCILECLLRPVAGFLLRAVEHARGFW